MKGEIYVLLKRFVESQWDTGAWEQVYKKALPQLRHRGEFLAAFDFHEDDFRHLISCFAQELSVSPGELLEALGRSVFAFYSPYVADVLTAQRTPKVALLALRERVYRATEATFGSSRDILIAFMPTSENELVVTTNLPDEAIPFFEGLLAGLSEFYRATIRTHALAEQGGLKKIALVFGQLSQ